MSEHTSFLEIFPGTASHASSCGGLEKAYVTDVEISLEAGTMSIRAHFARTPAPAELDSICTALRADYGLRVSIIADGPEVQKAAAASASVSSAPSGGSGKVLMGHSIKKSPTPLGQLNQDSGRVAIEGDLFEVTSRKLKKRDLPIDAESYMNLDYIDPETLELVPKRRAKPAEKTEAKRENEK